MSLRVNELEAKLLVPDDATFEALCRLERIGPLELRNPRERRQHNVYFDTASFRLFRAGYACRIRREGGRALATLKGLGSTAGAIHRREEHEAELAAPTLDVLLALTEEPWPRVLALAGGEPLVELFTNQTVRHKRDAWLDGQARVELALDRARFLVASGTRRLLEAELESLDGDAQVIERAAAELRERYGLADSTLSKFQRGLRWAGIHPSRRL